MNKACDVKTRRLKRREETYPNTDPNPKTHVTCPKMLSYVICDAKAEE